ncbi:bis(5'-nucleosyl)-tetraphosphatase [Xylocopilactobacillus apis]|uniref:Bis(5'-nucleosyl)-tetraphosphatase [asymmetrical] n=1 Tax=Xylocopilactobacillus apis TaxID=2932183 RepID=A0AAU9DG46_9LACO|nr:NUDIX domain-containing protein [Xylocopilactobacillus apis]BDR57226.1 phosphohydrolase [Xylocopilactobacillus apis]
MTLEISTGAVVYRKNKGKIEYLLEQSATSHFWGFPKGHVEGNETDQEAAEREIREETGLNVHVDTNDFREVDEYPLANGNQKRTIIYLAEVQGNPKLIKQDVEISHLDWFNYEDARTTLTYETLKLILKKANNYLIGK